MEMADKFIFDVDGTLTPSRGKIDKKFGAWFHKFCEWADHDVYLVTGSDRPKTIEQIGEPIYHVCKRVYNCSGCDVYEGDRNVRSSLWVLPDMARDFLDQCLYESDWPTLTGLHIEERCGMINFSVVGRNADSIDRKAYYEYDKIYSERVKIAKAFNTMFPDLLASVAGETGMDISAKGNDKSQILKDFDDKDRIYFFGDKVGVGGNDFLLAQALEEYEHGATLHVRDWKDTWKALKGL